MANNFPFNPGDASAVGRISGKPDDKYIKSKHSNTSGASKNSPSRNFHLGRYPGGQASGVHAAAAGRRLFGSTKASKHESQQNAYKRNSETKRG